MRGSVVVAVAVAVVTVPALAVAAPHPVSTNTVAGGSTTVTTCGSLGSVTVSWTVQNDIVKKLVLTGLPASCAGGAVRVTLVDATDASLATAGPVSVTGTSMTLSSLTGSATATSVSRAQLVVVGP